jgi:hypothetical protein
VVVVVVVKKKGKLLTSAKPNALAVDKWFERLSSGIANSLCSRQV